MLEADYPQYYEQIQKELPSLITSALRQLLENKHLYQKIEVDVKELMMWASIESKCTSPRAKPFAAKCFEILNWTWLIENKPTGHRKVFDAEALIFSLPTIKIFCSTCNRIEPFNAYPPDAHAILDHIVTAKRQQIFILEYECQSCKGLPTVFMLRREALKLFLEGRSPIEHVDVPKVIPKEQRKYYSDAIVAHNSGQTLAGLFLLRTFVEQYVRSLSPNTELLADKLIESYMEQLPVDFKARFPSLGKIYSDLSGAIHKAEASVELFDKTIADLTQHFDAKKLFKIDDKTLPIPEEE
jgi:hypothetical protein